jgi:chaperonin GroEL
MAKNLTFKNKAREKILSGAEKLAKVVAVTMGPQGKNVILGKFVGAPVLTKDGVTVAREVTLEEPVEELACQLIKEVAGRTAAVAGDGTTTATVLTHEILKRGCELIDTNYSPLNLRTGIEWTLKEIIKNLDSMAIDVSSLEDLENIATISANNDPDLGCKIAEAFHSVGMEGTVVAEALPGTVNSVRFADGAEVKAGFITPAFLTEEGQTEVNLNNCKILIYNDEISNLASCLGLFNELSDTNTPVLILAKAVKQEVLATLVANNKLGRLRAVAVNLPVFGSAQGEWLEALSVLVGTKVFSSEGGVPLREAKMKDLGFAKRITVGRYSTKILEGRKDEARFLEKLELYRKDLTTLVGDNERIDTKKRIAFIQNKAAVVSVGYSTELELREKGDRVDDSICATRAAIEEGYVPGGGTALLRAAKQVDLSLLDDALVPAARVLIDACERPMRQIVENAYADSNKIIDKVLSVRNNNYGYNAATNVFEDLVQSGVIDPKKVTKTALENATSISLLLINTDAVVSEQPENPSSWQAPAGWRPPQEGTLAHKY